MVNNCDMKTVIAQGLPAIPDHYGALMLGEPYITHSMSWRIGAYTGMTVIVCQCGWEHLCGNDLDLGVEEYRAHVLLEVKQVKKTMKNRGKAP